MELLRLWQQQRKKRVLNMRLLSVVMQAAHVCYTSWCWAHWSDVLRLDVCSVLCFIQSDLVLSPHTVLSPVVIFCVPAEAHLCVFVPLKYFVCTFKLEPEDSVSLSWCFCTFAFKWMRYFHRLSITCAA